MSVRNVALGPDFIVKLDEIRRLLAEAYEHYFANSDGCCKSSEGAVSISFPPFFWREDYANEEPSIEVYSYVLGPSRTHYFKNVDEALKTVIQWHAAEMAHDYSDDGWGDLDD